MHLDIVIPEVGESVQEAVLAEWFVTSGQRVSKGTVLFVLETDKVTLEVPAEADGVVEILVPAGEKVHVGSVVGRLLAETLSEEPPPPPTSAPALEPHAPPSREPKSTPLPVQEPAAEKAPILKAAQEPSREARAHAVVESEKAFPSAARLALQMGVDVERVKGTGPDGKITRGDVLLFLESQGRAVSTPFPPASVSGEKSTPTGLSQTAPVPPVVSFEERARPPVKAAEPAMPEQTRKPMSPLRKRIAERLLHAKHATAMLTTFNEVDMSRVVEFRRRFKDAFKKKHGVSLGFMSFFVKACVQALQEIPQVNAFIDGEDMVYNAHVHMGIAVGAERGLVVPVIRYADLLSFAEIEKAIDDFVQKIQENRLQLRDLEGGTFSITNGGIFGSLLSTPILNPPQSAILGLHKIEDRPIVLEGQVVIRPMMYVALSYDHRIIDGREAVTFLRRIKECIEDPERLLVGI